MYILNPQSYSESPLLNGGGHPQWGATLFFLHLVQLSGISIHNAH
jgi:hypothetical protein